MRFIRAALSVLILAGALACVADIGSSQAQRPNPGTAATKPQVGHQAKSQAMADVDEVMREQQEIGALIRESQSDKAVAGQSLVWPLPDDAEVSSPFGMRQHPILKAPVLHSGIDIAAADGTPIRACGRGKVLAVTVLKAYGSVIVIDHGGGLATVYAHLSTVAVKEGQSVGEGEVVGKVGRTGQVTGPHLHLEVRKSGDPVNPLICVQPPK